MTNEEFLENITQSFMMFLETGSRSNEKLKILHSSIALDLKERLGDQYDLYSLGLEGGFGKESNIQGRYIDKKVDITIKKGSETMAGIGVKFVMQNYSQNSNNYFENMLGETANIRSANIPYFQVFIIPDKLPYYDKDGNFKHWECFSEHNDVKYKELSKDNIENFFHTPTKTLLYVLNLPQIKDPKNKKEYIKAYESLPKLTLSESKTSYGNYDKSVIYNDYEEFAEKVTHYIKSL